MEGEMGFLKRLFGGRSEGRTAADEVTFSRSNVNPTSAAPGQERQVYVQRVSAILGRPVAELDLATPLIAKYGCDEMEVSECVQIAEEIWGVSLMPNPMKVSDYADMVKRFPCLDAIIGEAERKVKKKG
jgi:hypothetical protein